MARVSASSSRSCPGFPPALRLPLAALTLGHGVLPRRRRLAQAARRWRARAPRRRSSPAPARRQAGRPGHPLVHDATRRQCRRAAPPRSAPAAARPPAGCLGQAAGHAWPGKSAQQTEVSQRLQNQLLSAPLQAWPRDYNERGAWNRHSFEATGWFRTHHDGRRWWLVDPAGSAFWSAGINGLRSSVETCVTHMQGALAWAPDASDFEYAAVRRHNAGEDTVDFLQANLMRAFGPNAWHSHWSAIVLAQLRRCGFNTMATIPKPPSRATPQFPGRAPSSPPPSRRPPSSGATCPTSSIPSSSMTRVTSPPSSSPPAPTSPCSATSSWIAPPGA